MEYQVLGKLAADYRADALVIEDEVLTLLQGVPVVSLPLDDGAELRVIFGSPQRARVESPAGQYDGAASGLRVGGGWLALYAASGALVHVARMGAMLRAEIAREVRPWAAVLFCAWAGVASGTDVRQGAAAASGADALWPGLWIGLVIGIVSAFIAARREVALADWHDDNTCPGATCLEAERLGVDGLSHDALMRQIGSEEEREHYGRRMAAQETAGLLRQVGEHELARRVEIKIAGRAGL